MCGRRAAVCFYLSHGLVQVCEIELSHVGKNKGNPNLVWETKMVFSGCLCKHFSAKRKKEEGR